MKPFDLYQHFHRFCEMLDNESLELKTRIDMGREWIRSLPVPILCAPYELSRMLVQQAMEGRLQEMNKQYGQRIRETQEADDQGKVEAQLQAPPRPKSLREIAGDGGGKAAVEALDRPKVSKAGRKGRKAEGLN